MSTNQPQGVTPDETAAFYRSMTWQDLVMLRRAFTIDRRAAVKAKSRESVAFCNGRIAAIDAEFKARDGKAQSVGNTRFASAFGKREMELAAMSIFDRGLLDEKLFMAEAVDVTDDLERAGFEMLVGLGWLYVGPDGPAHGYFASEEFKQRVMEAVAKDEDRD